MGRLLTVVEAAEVLNTGERFVRRLISERRIAFHRLGRKVRIDHDDLVAFVAAGRVTPPDESAIWRTVRRVA